MHKFSITTLLILSLTVTNAQDRNSLTVMFEGLKNNEGKVYVALYNTEESFMKKEIIGTSVNINDAKASIVFEDLKPGNYAISSFHDENNNGKLDTNIIGIPKESYAFSNNVKGSLGPPKFRAAKFTISSKNESIRINF